MWFKDKYLFPLCVTEMGIIEIQLTQFWFTNGKVDRYFMSSILFNRSNTSFLFQYPAGIYLFKVNNGNTRAMCEICSKLKIRTPERRH